MQRRPRRTLCCLLLTALLALLAAPLTAGAAEESDGAIPSVGTAWGQPGPYDVKVDIDVAHTFYYPQDMGQSGERHPVIIWGNGTGAVPGVYSSLLRHWASHGFIVAAANTPASNFGLSMRAGIDVLERRNADSDSEFHQKVDLEHIASAGHSQGGAAAVNAAIDPRVDTAVPIQPGPLTDPDLMDEPVLLPRRTTRPGRPAGPGEGDVPTTPPRPGRLRRGPRRRAPQLHRGRRRLPRPHHGLAPLLADGRRERPRRVLRPELRILRRYDAVVRLAAQRERAADPGARRLTAPDPAGLRSTAAGGAAVSIQAHRELAWMRGNYAQGQATCFPVAFVRTRHGPARSHRPAVPLRAIAPQRASAARSASAQPSRASPDSAGQPVSSATRTMRLSTVLRWQ